MPRVFQFVLPCLFGFIWIHFYSTHLINMINIILSDFLEYHLNMYICICIAVEKMVKWNLLQDFFHISGQRFETDFRLFEHARSILKALKLNDDEKALKDLVLAVVCRIVFCFSTCLCISGTIQGAGNHNHLEWFSPLGEDHLEGVQYWGIECPESFPLPSEQSELVVAID